MNEPKPDTMMLMGNINTTGECVTMRSEMEDLSQVIDMFARFIKAVGFDTEGQRLILVDEEILSRLGDDLQVSKEACEIIFKNFQSTEPKKESK